MTRDVRGTAAAVRHDPARAATALERCLGSWRCDPGLIAEVRRLHASALNSALLSACVARTERRSSDRLEALADAIPATTWTTPALAYAYYVPPADDASDWVEECARALTAVAESDSPLSPRLHADDVPDWVHYALGILEADQADEQHRVRLTAVPSAAHARAACEQALIHLRQAWPEAAFVFDALVREVRWFTTEQDPSRSATLGQTFGAIFMIDDVGVVEAMENIVHECTHLELVARSALVDYLTNPGDTGRSPFRRQARPLSRILHAAVVNARILHLYDRAIDVLPGALKSEATARAAATTGHLRTALRSLDDAARWTPVGAALFDSILADFGDHMRNS